jgi:hypothetical protein
VTRDLCSTCNVASRLPSATRPRRPSSARFRADVPRGSVPDRLLMRTHQMAPGASLVTNRTATDPDWKSARRNGSSALLVQLVSDLAQSLSKLRVSREIHSFLFVPAGYWPCPSSSILSRRFPQKLTPGCGRLPRNFCPNSRYTRRSSVSFRRVCKILIYRCRAEVGQDGPGGRRAGGRGNAMLRLARERHPRQSGW